MKTAQEVLTSAGFPSQIVVCDFETYFAKGYSLSGMGTYEYIMHPEFEVQCCGFKNDAHCHVFGSFDTDAALKKQSRENITWSFHNAAFDCAILAKRYNIFPRFIIDTKLLAAHLWPASSHSLKDVAAQSGLPAKGDTQNFMGLRYATMTPAQRQAYIDYTTRDVELQWEVGLRLLPLIDNPATELRSMQHTIELATKPCIRFDYAKADEIRQGMLKDTQEALAKTGCTERQISGTISFEKLMVKALTKAGDNPNTYFKQGKKDEILAIAKDDAERFLLLKHKDETVRSLMNARVAKKSWPLHLKRIDRMELLANANDGLLPVPLNYAGCVTLRPSGAYKINLLNLPKRGHDLLLQMREMLAAQPGHKIVSIDLSGIEARILAWLAGQDDLTQMFENDADIYSDFAGDFYHCAVWKPDDNEIPAIAKQVKAKRGFGKVCILGMGYGMGPTRFSDYADCDQQTAESAVNFYRRKYPKIPQFWYELQEAFYFAPSKGDKISIEAGWQGPASRAIRLPSGRLIRYPELQGTKDDMSIKWSDRSREHVWGGLLVENCCQAIARDVLTEAINRIEARGFHVCHHVYDQILIHCPERNAEEAKAIGEEELTRREGWTASIPLGAEGVIGDSYAKDN